MPKCWWIKRSACDCENMAKSTWGNCTRDYYPTLFTPQKLCDASTLCLVGVGFSRPVIEGNLLTIEVDADTKSSAGP